MFRALPTGLQVRWPAWTFNPLRRCWSSLHAPFQPLFNKDRIKGIVEFPEIGDSVQEKDSIGTIEAVKTVADIYSPVRGDILEVNVNLEDNPDIINTDPYDTGWIIKLNNLTINDDIYLTPDQYMSLIQ